MEAQERRRGEFEEERERQNAVFIVTKDKQKQIFKREIKMLNIKIHFSYNPHTFPNKIYHLSLADVCSSV